MSRSGISDISTKGAEGRGGQNFSLAVKVLQDHRISFSGDEDKVFFQICFHKMKTNKEKLMTMMKFVRLDNNFPLKSGNKGKH